MSVALLDVNVLIALLDPAHITHNEAHRWFGVNRKHGWATCPITVNGCVRILSNPAYPGVNATPSDVAARMQKSVADSNHHFWVDSLSLLDERVFQMPMIGGHKTITDAYLLGLAVRNHGRLVTFDRSIPLKAVHGARAENLTVIGNS